ncbi:MAG TPA: hypothetical protein VHT30_11560 [Acidimicrobiales bacterium]|jgi:hypothetical protein|nr:hypothetical protein [Acidimicrobiales bacterium]
MPPPDPPAVTRSEELLRVAQEYADLFNSQPLDNIDRLIADACVDPLWDDRTNLLSFMAEDTTDVGLVLAVTRDDYVIVRFVDGWIVDTTPEDWEAMEDQAFDEDGDDEDDEPQEG